MNPYFGKAWFVVFVGIQLLFVAAVARLFFGLPAWLAVYLFALGSTLWGGFVFGEYLAQAVKSSTMTAYAFVKVGQRWLRVTYGVEIVIVMAFWFPRLPFHTHWIVIVPFALWLPFHYAGKQGPLLAIVNPLLRRIGWIV